MRVVATVQFAATARFEVNVPDNTNLENPPDNVVSEILDQAETMRELLKFDVGLRPLEKKV